MGFPVSESELQMGDLLQSLSFAPVGFGIGVAGLFFPHHVLRWYDKLLGRVRTVYPPWDLFVFRKVGLFFILATLMALWTTGKFLFQ
jgi:hypothetical protein